MAQNKLKLRKVNQERAFAYDLKQEFKKQANDILLIPSLTESIRKEISQEKKELIVQKKQTKSIEQERQRIERLKDRDFFAY